MWRNNYFYIILFEFFDLEQHLIESALLYFAGKDWENVLLFAHLTQSFRDGSTDSLHFFSFHRQLKVLFYLLQATRREGVLQFCR